MHPSPDPWHRWIVVSILGWIGGLSAALAQEQTAISPESANPATQSAPVPRGTLLLVVGAPGTAEYGELFTQAAQRWKQGAEAGGLECTVIGEPATDGNAPSDRDRLQQALEAARNSTLPLWLIMIGHGTFDGRAAKFNLRGDDISAEELREQLALLNRPLAIVAAFSASAPFLDANSGPGRVILSATKSGAEVNASRFGNYLAQAVIDSANDLDKDGQVSLLESFLTAARLTQAFYDGEGRLATEHPLLDDNGDSRGTRAESYQGIRLVEKDSSVDWDGLRAHQWHLIPSIEERRLPPELAARRDELELAIAKLRDLKPTLPQDVYYRHLEALLLDMARIYATLDEVQ